MFIIQPCCRQTLQKDAKPPFNPAMLPLTNRRPTQVRLVYSQHLPPSFRVFHFSISFILQVDDTQVNTTSFDVRVDPGGPNAHPNAAVDQPEPPALFTGPGVPNLYGQVRFLNRRPVYSGTYSRVHVGTYRAQKVIVVLFRDWIF